MKRFWPSTWTTYFYGIRSISFIHITWYISYLCLLNGSNLNPSYCFVRRILKKTTVIKYFLQYSAWAHKKHYRIRIDMLEVNQNVDLSLKEDFNVIRAYRSHNVKKRSRSTDVFGNCVQCIAIYAQMIQTDCSTRVLERSNAASLADKLIRPSVRLPWPTTTRNVVRTLRWTVGC